MHKIMSIVKLLFVCSEFSNTEKQNIGLLPVCSYVSSVHQDVWCGCEDEGRQVLPGQGAGPGMWPPHQTGGQTDLHPAGLPHRAAR